MKPTPTRPIAGAAQDRDRIGGGVAALLQQDQDLPCWVLVGAPAFLLPGSWWLGVQVRLLGDVGLRAPRIGTIAYMVESLSRYAALPSFTPTLDYLTLWMLSRPSGLLPYTFHCGCLVATRYTVRS